MHAQTIDDVTAPVTEQPTRTTYGRRALQAMDPFDFLDAVGVDDSRGRGGNRLAGRTDRAMTLAATRCLRGAR